MKYHKTRPMVRLPGHPRAWKQSGYVYEHILLVENALGHFLGKRHVVHHVDYDRTNNAQGNLVACENEAYHNLLHLRTDALREIGDKHARRCKYCKQWDHLENLRFYKNTGTVHSTCDTIRKGNIPRKMKGLVV